MEEPTTEPHPLDEDRDPANVAAVRGFAAEVAAQYGGDLTRMRRALGYSNATWVGDGVAVRVTHTPVDMLRTSRSASWRHRPRDQGRLVRASLMSAMSRTGSPAHPSSSSGPSKTSG